VKELRTYIVVAWAFSFRKTVFECRKRPRFQSPSSSQCCFLFCLLRSGYQLALEGGAVDVELRDCATKEGHRAVRSGLSRDSWLPSVRLPMECHARHRSNGVCCHVYLDRSDSALLAAPKNRSHGTTVNNGSRPVDLAITRKPIQQHEVNQVPHSGVLPIA
jgi:hypothetical protein